MTKRINLLNLPVDSLTMEETISLIDKSIINNTPLHHVVVNAAKIVNAQKDLALKESIENCDIINADGQAVVWASQFLNKPLPERVAGIDIMENLVQLASKKNYKIFFLGAKEEVVKKVVERYSKEFGEKIIAGYRDGYFNSDQELEVAEEIARVKPDILFVAISSPKKEIFLNTYKNHIKAPFIMGVGGSFDVVSGLVKRAPVWMQKNGLEWLYRVYQEPGRMWKRYLTTNWKFLVLLLKHKLRS